GGQLSVTKDEESGIPGEARQGSGSEFGRVKARKVAQIYSALDTRGRTASQDYALMCRLMQRTI
ncbi:hypothetical protein, partial [Pseudoduganella rivuli]|uniref:hypothetical protein n=1 Tax=Pseudoduganella rivuli TaxID=2666085 RepID=UPI001E28CF15